MSDYTNVVKLTECHEQEPPV